MKPLLFDPHGDDAVLFASFVAMTYDVHVVVTNRTVPADEIAAAMRELGCTWQEGWDPMHDYSETIFVPAWHEVGHEEHNEVARQVGLVYLGEEVHSYCTYAPRGNRQIGSRESYPTPYMIQRKLRALSCFGSQIEQPTTRPWFHDLLDMREWLA